MIEFKDFYKDLVQSFYEDINQRVHERKQFLEKRLRRDLFIAITQSPEVKSMLNGVLRGEFGFQAGEEESYVEPMVDFASSRVTVNQFTLNTSRGNPQLALDIIWYDFDVQQLLDVQNASYQSKGGPVNWLEWILLAGDSIVVQTHYITYGFNKQRSSSRSGLAIMKKTTGKGYRVPPAYSGIETDNFLTRAALQVNLEKAIQEELF